MKQAIFEAPTSGSKMVGVEDLEKLKSQGYIGLEQIFGDNKKFLGNPDSLSVISTERKWSRGLSSPDSPILEAVIALGNEKTRMIARVQSGNLTREIKEMDDLYADYLLVIADNGVIDAMTNYFQTRSWNVSVV